MYEDQYLSHFKKESYSEGDDYIMTDEEYLKEYGSKRDLDVEDIKKKKDEKKF